MTDGENTGVFVSTVKGKGNFQRRHNIVMVAIMTCRTHIHMTYIQVRRLYFSNVQKVIWKAPLNDGLYMKEKESDID